MDAIFLPPLDKEMRASILRCPKDGSLCYIRLDSVDCGEVFVYIGQTQPHLPSRLRSDNLLTRISSEGARSSIYKKVPPLLLVEGYWDKTEPLIQDLFEWERYGRGSIFLYSPRMKTFIDDTKRNRPIASSLQYLYDPKNYLHL